MRISWHRNSDVWLILVAAGVWLSQTFGPSAIDWSRQFAKRFNQTIASAKRDEERPARVTRQSIQPRCRPVVVRIVTFEEHPACAPQFCQTRRWSQCR